MLLEAVQRDDDPVGVAALTGFEGRAGQSDRGLFGKSNALAREAGERGSHNQLPRFIHRKSQSATRLTINP